MKRRKLMEVNKYVIAVVILTLIVLILAELELYSHKRSSEVVVTTTDIPENGVMSIAAKDSGLKHDVYIYDASKVKTKDIRQQLKIPTYVKSTISEHIAGKLNKTGKKLWTKVVKDHNPMPINRIYNAVNETGRAVAKVVPDGSLTGQLRMLTHPSSQLSGFIDGGRIYLKKVT